MNHGSLFAGIGGFDLASEWMGWENIFQVEIDDFCNQVLEKHFPDTKRYKDIYEFDGKKYKEAVDIISAGWPCQKYSLCGLLTGNEKLKDEMLRVISEIMPPWIVLENVYGFISGKFAKEHDILCKYLENLGYEIQTFDIDASSVGLQTLERHIWIIATTFSIGQQGGKKESDLLHRIKRKFQRNDSQFNYGRDISKTRFCRVGERVSGKLDKYQRDRLKSLGNAVVPQVVFEIFKAIEQVYEKNIEISE